MERAAISAHGMKITIAILLMVLAGCASNYKDFKVSDVDDDEGIVIGKVSVDYNNNPYNTDLCKFCIGSTCHELLKDGYVIMPLKRNEDNSTISLECHYIGGQGDRTHILNIKPLKVKPGVTYVGNFLFSNKEVSSDQLTSDMVLPQKVYTGGRGLFGVAGVLLLPEGKPMQVVGAVLSIKDDIPSVLSAYQKQAGNETAQVAKNIITVGLIPQAGRPELMGFPSNYKDFQLSKVDKGEGVVIGKVTMTYNNKPYNTDYCVFCIGSTCHDPLEEGYVFIPLKSGESHSVLSMQCHYDGGLGDLMHGYKINPLEVKPGVTYFGVLHFEANEVMSDQVPPGMVLPQKTNSGGGLGAMGISLSTEKGPRRTVGAILSVKDEMPSVLEAFQRQVGNSEAQAEKSVVTVEVQTEK